LQYFYVYSTTKLPVVRQRNYLKFYEYRRKLLNCYKEYERDYTNCAKDYMDREKSPNYMDRERYFSSKSYEQYVIPRVELQDAFLHLDSTLNKACFLLFFLRYFCSNCFKNQKKKKQLNFFCLKKTGCLQQ